MARPAGDVARPVFHAPTATLLGARPIVLDGPEGRHAATVRRLRVGEELLLTDGAGTAVTGRVASVVDRGTLTVDVVTVTEQPPPDPWVVVAQALPKGERGETAVGTMTEVGVDEVVPWSAQRCVTRWSEERAVKGVTRWRAAAAEAAKQSRRSWWPSVSALVETDAVAARLAAAALGVVLHEEATTAIGDVPVPDHGDVVLVVGPEGGLAPEEVAAFTAAGGVLARLGPTVLRTSTAGTVAAAVLLARTRRWRVDPAD